MSKYLNLMTLWICLVETNKVHKKHVYNSVIPIPNEPFYNISTWVRQLHLQQCVIIEIGEKYCGVNRFKLSKTISLKLTEPNLQALRRISLFEASNWDRSRRVLPWTLRRRHSS